jgi:hypothetical protein
MKKIFLMHTKCADCTDINDRPYPKLVFCDGACMMCTIIFDIRQENHGICKNGILIIAKQMVIYAVVCSFVMKF